MLLKETMLNNIPENEKQELEKAFEHTSEEMLAALIITFMPTKTEQGKRQVLDDLENDIVYLSTCKTECETPLIKVSIDDLINKAKRLIRDIRNNKFR